MASSLQPRVCKLTKREGQSFGFFLRIEQGKDGHLIRSVEKGGPAEQAGLRDGDRVLRVNGTFVDLEDHNKVVELIKNSGSSVTFLVLDENAYEKAKKQGVNFCEVGQSKPSNQPPLQNGVVGSSPRPRLCYLVKDGGYGFSLKSIQGKKGLRLIDVATNKPAAKAEVQENDRLIEVNGQNVENATHDQVVLKIKDSGDSIILLVADEEVTRFYTDKKIALKGEMASVKQLPHKPKVAELTKGADGYGFFLRLERGRQGHFIRDIDSGSPAQMANLKDDDRLVAVNGVSVESLEHEEVVEKIRECGNKTTLLVVDKKTDELYRKAGISPLVYWREVQESSTDHMTTEAPPYPYQDQVKYTPKLCHLVKGTTGYGFHMNAIRGAPGQFIKEVAKGSPAEKAGMEDDDIIVEVNGVNVENMLHEDAVLEVRKSKDKLTLLVATKEAYDYFKANKIPITAALVEAPDVSNGPATPPSSGAAFKAVATADATSGPATRSVAPQASVAASEAVTTEDVSNGLANPPSSTTAIEEVTKAEPTSSPAVRSATPPSNATPFEEVTTAEPTSSPAVRSVIPPSSATTLEAETKADDATNSPVTPPSSAAQTTEETKAPVTSESIPEESRDRKNFSSSSDAASADDSEEEEDNDNTQL